MKKLLKRMGSLVCALAIVTAVGLTVFAGSWSVTNTSINSRGFNLSATGSGKGTSQLLASYTIKTYDGKAYTGTMNTGARAYYANGTVGAWQGIKTGTNVNKVTGTTSWIPGTSTPSYFVARYGLNGTYMHYSNSLSF